MNFSEIAKSLRVEQGLTQKQLSEKLNIGQSTIVGYEKGAREPIPKSLNAYADFFGISTDYLLGREDDLGIVISHTTKNDTSLISSQEKKFLSLFKKLGPFEQETIMIQLEALVNKKIKV